MLQLVLTLVCIAIVTVGRLVAPAKWDALPKWARRIPVVLTAVAGALLPVLGAPAGSVVDWALVGETAWTTAAGAFGAVELLKVMPWAKLVGLLKRLPALLSLGALVLLSSCAALTPAQANTAATVLDAACALDLVQAGAVAAEAELEGVPVQWLADTLCADPQAYAAWLAARNARTPGAGPAAALASARARGLVR